MAVVSSKREESKLRVLDFAKDLKMEMFKTCVGEKGENKTPLFPKKYWHVVVVPLLDMSSKIYRNLITANSIFFDKSITETEFEARRALQTEAIALLFTLSVDLDFAWELCGLSEDTIWKLMSKITTTLDYAKAWKESDEKRYKSFKTQKL